MPQFLVSHHWSWGSTSEIGVHTLAVDSNTDDSASLAASAATAFETFVSTEPTWTALFCNAVDYTRLVVNEIIDLSLGTLGAGFQVPLTGGGTAAGIIPPQNAVCVSLTAGVYPDTGQPVRGRFYLPTVSNAALGNDGRITLANGGAIHNAVLNYMNALTDAGKTVSVWSRKLGALQQVTSVRTGLVVDTIRSRRNALEEQYVP